MCHGIRKRPAPASMASTICRVTRSYMSAIFTDCSLLIGLLLVVEQVAKLACDLTRPAPMSGGFVVKDSSEGGVSPGLHKRGTPRAEDWGDPRRCRRGHRPPKGILDNVGGCKPPLPPA